MRLLAERTFTLEDQLSFAALSGDFNPMHVDPVAARRTIFGAPVVHGVHLLCWALDRWLELEHGGAAIGLASLNANFQRGALIGETVRVVADGEGEDFDLRIQREASELTTIYGTLGPPAGYSEALPPARKIECRLMDPALLPQAQGSLPLSYSPNEAKALFPRLSAALPAHQLAALLASTRLIGMECPGLHSLYSMLDLTFDAEAAGPPRFNYQVVHARDGCFVVAVDGPGFQGELEGLIRPAPRSQAPMATLAPLLEKDEFAGQRAVVIGGSRGLGEVAAKLLALGGADVTLTYHRGQDDARKVAAEIQASGGSCRVAQFDAGQPAALDLSAAPTQIYYFATPQITADKTAIFSPDRFAEYCRFYVTDFVRTVLAVAQNAQSLDVLYPSTVFLDEAPANLAEYCAAKAAGEEMCKQLGRRFPGWRLHAPRLPRMLTDQNNGLLPEETEAPERVMLGHLREMKRP